jgi:hypothetical protein
MRTLVLLGCSTLLAACGSSSDENKDAAPGMASDAAGLADASTPDSATSDSAPAGNDVASADTAPSMPDAPSGTALSPAPVTVTLKVNGSPVTIEGIASWSLSPASTTSVFWEVGAIARSTGPKEGILKSGEFGLSIHVNHSAMQGFAYNLVTLTPDEYKGAANCTLRAGPDAAKFEMVWSAKGKDGMSGEFTVDNAGVVTFKMIATMPGDPVRRENDGTPRTVEVTVSGLPKPTK